jgi:tetratricopeptide (TPR) repeat protein
VVRRQILREQKLLAKQPASPQEKLQAQLQTLIKGKQYIQAHEKLKQLQKMYPDTELEISEAQLWLLRGQQEYDQANYRQAQKSLQQALDLGLKGEAHYWFAKCLLALNETDAALAFIKTAFESKVLPKEYAGCYLKLLFLKGDTTTITELINRKSKPFLAPQLHWARGVLAMQAGNPQEAIAHFQKMGRNATPGDSPMAWVAYVQQQMGAWDKAALMLGLKHLIHDRFLTPNVPKHPALERLLLMQAALQKQSLEKAIALPNPDVPNYALVLVIELLNCIESGDYYNAAFILGGLESPCREFPEIDGLVRPLCLQAAEQAMQNQAPEDAEEFLAAIVYQPPFDSQIALKLHLIYGMLDPLPEHQRLLTHWLDWLKKEAQKDPQAWSASRLNPIRARLYCWLTDLWMSKGQHQQGYKALQEAERLCPDSAEVIGRQGLKAYMQHKTDQAIVLLTQALEGGCRFGEVYSVLLELLDKRGDQKASKDIRRRFGQSFGDLNPDLEAEQPRWVEALATQNYQAFRPLVTSKRSDSDSALQACRIFVQATEGEPNSGGRIGLNQEKARKDWDKLLARVSDLEKIPVLQAIFLAVHLFAKRQKGIAALLSQYQQQLFALSEQYSEAKISHLVLLVVKGLAPDRLELPFMNYLARSPQPGTALAQVQLQARQFVQTSLLRPLIDKYLQREPQNPLLLLAKATTYLSHNKEYQKLHQQGFELARRLQDNLALQAFRAEEAFQTGMMAGDLLPDFMEFEASGAMDVPEIMRKVMEKMFGQELPPEVLDQILPEFARMAAAEMNSMDFEFDDDENDDFFEIDLSKVFKMETKDRTPAKRRSQQKGKPKK